MTPCSRSQSEVRRYGTRFADLCRALAVCVILPPAASAREHRFAAVKHEFQLTLPCPAIGSTSSPCPGYVKAHIVPLACGGPDAVSNMQWQPIREARQRINGRRGLCSGG
jgi:hypothetical protein